MNSTREHWLVDVARLEPGQTLEVYPRGDLTAEVGQAAIDAQYGRGSDFRAKIHGNAFWVTRWANWAARQRWPTGGSDAC